MILKALRRTNEMRRGRSKKFAIESFMESSLSNKLLRFYRLHPLLQDFIS